MWASCFTGCCDRRQAPPRRGGEGGELGDDSEGSTTEEDEDTVVAATYDDVPGTRRKRSKRERRRRGDEDRFREDRKEDVNDGTSYNRPSTGRSKDRLRAIGQGEHLMRKILQNLYRRRHGSALGIFLPSTPHRTFPLSCLHVGRTTMRVLLHRGHL